MYMSTVGVPYLIVISSLNFFGVEFNVLKYLLMIPSWGIYLGIFSLIVFGIFAMYVDLRFIIPSERRSSTGRDPVILGIVKKQDELLEKVNDLCGDSELQQRTYALPLVEAIGKPYSSKDSSG